MLADVYLDQVPPTPWDASHRGDIAKCAYDRLVTIAEMNDFGAGFALPAVGAVTDAHKLRISYWTERAPGVPVLTSGEILIPALRVGSPSPLITAAHGSVGMSDTCAPSKDPAGYDDQFQPYLLASHGWPVVQPDFPGLGTSGTPGWLVSSDGGHALLDATRAARKLAKPGFFATKNVIVGYSAGGHAAISAQSQVAAYGVDGTLDGVVGFAPSYMSHALFGLLASPLVASTPGLITPGTLSLGVMYFQSHLALLEGESHRDDAFLPGKAAAVDALFDGSCLTTTADPIKGLPSIGITKASDLFTTQYANELGNCAVLGSCTTALAQTWVARWVADRPPVDATIPIYLWGGAKDTVVPPSLTQCAIERIAAETTHFTACGDLAADHTTITGYAAPWGRDYLASVFLGAAAPAACTPYAVAVPGAKCASPPANDATDPTKP